MRALTLSGWLVLVTGLFYIVHVRGRDVPWPTHGAWIILAVRHGVVALTTAMVEAAWVVVAVMPTSSLAVAGKALYNPAYLLNAAISAMAPFLIVALLVGTGSVRRVCIAAVSVIGLLSMLAVAAGAVRDWRILMSWTQFLSFTEIAGHLTLWGLVLLGHLRRVDAYLLGMLVIVGLYTILLPIQAEFFELVGRADVNRIWHLNQLLQLVVVIAELMVVLAYINHLRNTRPHRAFSAAGSGG